MVIALMNVFVCKKLMNSNNDFINARPDVEWDSVNGVR